MSQTKNQKIDLRLTPSAKAFLQSAAQASQRTLSEFVLESAMRRAEETSAGSPALRFGCHQMGSFSNRAGRPTTGHQTTDETDARAQRI